MTFSIIIPSFNQGKFIRQTLENMIELKRRTFEKGIQTEILLFDNESEEAVQKIISEFNSFLDYIDIKKDKGQYDAINNGIKMCTGDYWTWLNTDDTIDIEGFLRLVDVLKSNSSIDYIYGNIQMIDLNGTSLKLIKAKDLTFNRLIGTSAGIFQPGSFFRKGFTDKIGLLENYDCCFDYEYVLRVLAAGAKIHKCDFTVAFFRHYPLSKSGRKVYKFINEQLVISKLYGRKGFSRLSLELNLRKLKRKFFN